MKKVEEIPTVEIPVVIEAEILTENAELNEIYDAETHTLSYPVHASIPKEFYTKLEELVPKFKGTEIATFNPLMSAVAQLQAIKETKCLFKPFVPSEKQPEAPELKEGESLDEAERVYIDNNAIIGSFNSALTKAKKILKDEHVSMNKKIDTLFKLFETESINTRSALQTEFEPVLTEREKVKKAKEDKIKQDALDQIASLSTENASNLEKLKNTQNTARRLEIEKAISLILTSTNAAVIHFNKDGLQTKQETLQKLVFASYVTPNDELLFSQEVRDKLREDFDNSKTMAISTIAGKLQSLETAEKLVSVENENKVLSAQIPTTLVDDPNDKPDIQTPSHQVQQSQIPKEETDLDKMARLVYNVDYLISELDVMIANITEMEFQEPFLTATKNTLINDSFPKILDWSKKVQVWSAGRYTKYKAHIDSQNQVQTQNN